jgi:hypothetical protein
MTTVILEETTDPRGTGRKSLWRGVDGSGLVSSVQKKWRDSFTSALTDNWDVTTSGGVTATNSAGVLTIASGTTAGGIAELLSKEVFTIPFRVMAGVTSGATRQANTHHLIEIVSVDKTTGLPDGRHSIDIDIGGAASTTVTQAVYGTQNGGLRPLLSSAVTVVTTASYSVLELEPFADEAYWHSRTLDATTGRANSYVRHQQIPDPNAHYKLRIRSMNHAAWKSVTGAVAGTGGVIRLTVSAHGYSTGNTVWAEALNGVLNGTAEVRGNYVITSVDVDTIELDGTVFAGAYAAGSGRVALAAAPAAINLQFQFVNVQDYAELTAEITAGRGQTVQGQAIGVQLVGAPAATTAIGQVVAVGPVAHDAARSTTAPIINAARAVSAAYTTVATGDVADLITTLQGVLVTRPWQIPELEWSYAAAGSGIVNTTTAVTFRAAAGTGLRSYVTSIQVMAEALTNATELAIRDGAGGTVLWRTRIPTGGLPTMNVTFRNPLKSTANTLLEVVTLSASGAGAVYFNAQGFTAA